MRKYKLHILFGLLIILIGLIISSSFLIDFLRISPEGTPEDLLLGARLFKIGLVVIGGSIVFFGSMPIWRLGSVSCKKLNKTDKKFNLFFLIIIICAASALRIYGLNDGLWLDEILTQINYTKASFGEILTTYDSQNQHFLYSILSHGSYLLFGESAWVIRLPAVLFGLASIWALNEFGKKVLSRKVALFSCAFFTFSYHHIWFSQNARGYTGLLFFTLLSSLLLVRGLNENRLWQWIGYGIAVALGSYTHIMMVIIIFGHFLIYIFHLYIYKKKVLDCRWVPLVGFFFGGILIFQLYAFVLPQMFASTVSQGNIVASWKNPLWTLTEFIKGAEISLKGIVPGIIGLGIFIVGLWDFARRKPIVVELFIVPAVIVAFVTIFMGHHIWPRLFFFTFGFIVLILADGCMQFGSIIVRWLKLEQKKSTVFGTVLFLIILFASAISVPSAYGPKQDYLGAFSFVENNRDKQDVVFSVGAAGFVYERFYKVNWKWAESVDEIKAAIQSSKPIWLIYTLPFHLESVNPEIMSIIEREFIVAKRYEGTLNGGTIYVCRSKG